MSIKRAKCGGWSAFSGGVVMAWPVVTGGSGRCWEEPRRRELERRLTEVTADAHGRWSVAVVEHAPVAAVRADLVHPAASTIKVPLLLAALGEVADGRRDLADELALPTERTAGSGVLDALGSVTSLRMSEVLELMITVSDNTATNMLIDLLGTDVIESRMRDMGLRATSLRRRMLDQRAAAAGMENVATAAELAMLLGRLSRAESLPTELSETALAVLGRQQLNDRIPTFLPTDVECLHKTGELAGVCHDVGVLAFDGRRVAFAALGSELPDVAENGNGTGRAAAVIGAAARAVVATARGE